MKLIAATLLVVIVTVYAKDQDPVEECLSDNGIKPEQYEELKKKDDPKLNCIMACIFEKEGMLKNGEIDIDLTVKVLLKKQQNISEADMNAAVKACMEKGKGISDICEITNEFKKCIEKS